MHYGPHTEINRVFAFNIVVADGFIIVETPCPCGQKKEPRRDAFLRMYEILNVENRVSLLNINNICFFSS